MNGNPFGLIDLYLRFYAFGRIPEINMIEQSMNHGKISTERQKEKISLMVTNLFLCIHSSGENIVGKNKEYNPARIGNFFFPKL
jgi:hypothetical protein